jgi:hypothetical protein
VAGAAADPDERRAPWLAATWVEGLAWRLAPYADADRPAPLGGAERDAACRRLRRPLHLSTRLGTAFAVVEVEQRTIGPDKSDAVIASALGFASFLQTRFGPEHLGFYMWRSARVGYFLARGGEADPDGLLPDDADITVVSNEVAPRYGSATEAMQLTWDTLIAPRAPT